MDDAAKLLGHLSIRHHRILILPIRESHQCWLKYKFLQRAFSNISHQSALCHVQINESGHTVLPGTKPDRSY
jgi:hypothetical protein